MKIELIIFGILLIVVLVTTQAEAQAQTENQTQTEQQQGITSQEIKSALQNTTKGSVYANTYKNMMDVCFSDVQNIPVKFHQCMKIVNGFNAHMESLFKENRKIVNELMLGSAG